MLTNHSSNLKILAQTTSSQGDEIQNYLIWSFIFTINRKKVGLKVPLDNFYQNNDYLGSKNGNFENLADTIFLVKSLRAVLG